MKADPEVKMISAEAPILFAKGCDIFITELTMRAWIHAEDNKRRTLQRSDIAAALAKSDMFDFLIDIVPREESGAAGGSASKQRPTTSGGQQQPQQAAHPQQHGMHPPESYPGMHAAGGHIDPQSQYRGGPSLYAHHPGGGHDGSQDPGPYGQPAPGMFAAHAGDGTAGMYNPYAAAQGGYGAGMHTGHQ